jgi:DNA-directed RNA polymerase subunit RPC12/RpoP
LFGVLCFDCDKKLTSEDGKVRCKECNAKLNSINFPKKKSALKCEYCSEFASSLDENGECHACRQRSPDPTFEEIWEMARQIREERKKGFVFED